MLNKRRYVLVPSLLLATLVLSCTRAGKTSQEGDTQACEGRTLGTSQYMRLQAFASCEATDGYMRENMRSLLKDSFDQQRYSLEMTLKYYNQMEKTMSAPTSSPASDAAGGANESASSSAPKDFSRTNTQVAGVDEPDSVKTDGKTIYSISGSNIQITSSWPAQSMQKIATIAIQGQPLGLLLTEDQRLIVAYHPPLQRPTKPGYEQSMPAPSAISYPWSGGTSEPEIVRLAIYDVAQPAQPGLLKEHSFWGNYLSLRRQGHIIRLVQTLYSLPFPEGVQNYIDIYSNTTLPNGYMKWDPISLEEFDQRRAAIEEKNENLIGTFTLKASFRGLVKALGATTDDPILADTLDCSEIYASQRLGQLGYTTVTSLNLGDGQLSQSAVLAPANKLYASEGSLYLAHTMHAWWQGWSNAQGSKTYIHKFKYESPESVKLAYQGSGVVDGYILNQFALDEYQDVLRVAVTVEPSGGSGSGGGPMPAPVDDSSTSMATPAAPAANRVVTLIPGAEGLEEIGRTPDLAPGERIYSVRFAKDKGYVVTFRQVDPLYTLDLSDPRDLKVLGELKVSGYSSYIHMIDDGHLLTVGEEVDPITLRRMGLKISVFDVSDLSKPSEKFKYLVPSVGSSSQALYDHHAFNWFASRNLLAIPVSGYREVPSGSNWWDQYFAELQVFSIDLSKGIEPKGAVAVGDLYQGQKSIDWYAWQWHAQPSRSIFADDYIYAISTFGITAVHNQDLSTPLKAARFYP